MKTHVAFTTLPGYLGVKVWGEWSADTIEDVLQKIKLRAEHEHRDKILMDITRLNLPSTEATRFVTGELMATIFSYKFRLAGFTQMEKINYLCENAAVNRGASFRMFGTLDAAVEWLLPPCDSTIP